MKEVEELRREILQDKASEVPCLNRELQGRKCLVCGTPIPEQDDTCFKEECQKSYQDYLDDMSRQYD